MRQWRGRADPTCLLDALTAALLSAGGICLALFLAGQRQSLGVCLALAAGQALLCLAAGRRWWVLPALALGAGAAFGLWTLQAGWESVRAALVRAWAWIAAGMPAGGDLEPLRLPVLGLCTLPVTLAFYALARRWLPVALPALYALALGLAAYLADLPAAEGVLLCALGGAMLCLPRAMASLGQDGLPRRYGQALALPLAAACLAGAFFFVPREDGAWRSEPVRAVFSDVEDFYNYYIGGAAGGSARGRAELNPLGTRLGGDLHLTDEPVLRVRSDDPFPLLTGAIEDTYNGSQWYQGWRNGRFRFDSLLWRGRRAAVYLDALPLGGREARALYEAMTCQAEMEVTVLRSDYSLFFAGRPTSLRLGRGAEAIVYFNLAGELFAGAWVPRGFSYAVTSVQFCRSAPGFDENMARLLALTEGLEDPYEAEIRARYTHLPESLPESVRALAREIAQGSANDYEAMCRIEAWLRENCTYTETPGDPPEGVDFVAHFLETREGYCTYYASAMAVLARCCGLPSRYVTGYGLARDGESAYYAARGTSAHAWAEVYFHGVGWVPFDPLNWSAERAQAAETQAQEPAATPAPTPAPARATATAQPTPQPEAAFPREDFRGLAQAALRAAGVGLALAALWLLYRFLLGRKARAFALERLVRKQGRKGAGQALCADLERQMALYNLGRAAGETLAAWAQRVDRSLPLGEGAPTCAQAVEVCERLLYAERTPDQEELQTLWAYHDAVERALRAALGRSYFWRRALR